MIEEVVLDGQVSKSMLNANDDTLRDIISLSMYLNRYFDSDGHLKNELSDTDISCMVYNTLWMANKIKKDEIRRIRAFHISYPSEEFEKENKDD